MRITRIAAYQVNLPLYEGSYKWSGGKSVEVFDSTVVRLETDDGVDLHAEDGGDGLPRHLQSTRAVPLAPGVGGIDASLPVIGIST